MLNEVMLYYPLKREITFDEAENLYNEEFDGRRKIEIVKNQVMPFLQGVEEARYYVDQALKVQEKEKDLEKIAAKFEPNDDKNRHRKSYCKKNAVGGPEGRPATPLGAPRLIQGNPGGTSRADWRPTASA